MFKICWIKNPYQEVYDYYYDLSNDKVYCINLAEYNKTQFQATPGKVALCGPLASIFGTIFAGKIVVSSSSFFLFLTLITIITVVPISIAYDKTYKVQTQYIKENASSEHLEVMEVKELLHQGRIYIWGLTFSALVCLLFAWFGVCTTIFHHDQIGLVIYVGAIMATTIIIKMLSPYNLLKLLIRLEKNKVL